MPYPSTGEPIHSGSAASRRERWRRRDPHAGPGRRRRPTARLRASRSSAARRSTPTPTAGPEPTLRIIETRVLRGPNYWAREPVIRLLVDLGVLEEYPSNTLPNFTDALVALLPTLEDHACSLGRRGGFITRLRDGTWMGHVAEHVALEFQNLAGTDVRHGKTRAAGPYGQYNCIFEYREEAVGLEAGRMAVALVNHLVAPDDPEPSFRLRAGDGAADPARRAAGVRAVDAGAHRRGGQPRHPVLPARPPFARPVRPRRPPAADPGDDDLADLGHRRRRRVGQEPHQPAARLGRAAGAAGGRRRHRGRRGGGGQAARLPVRGQAARRQPRPGRPPRPALGGGRPRRVPRRAGPEPGRRRRGRELRRRQRLSLPGHRRQGRGHRRARPGVGDRRRRAHRPPAGRHRQQRPASRHRPREGADPDRGRPGGRGARRATRASRWTTCCRSGRGSSSP